MDKTSQPNENIERRMDELLGQMRDIGEMLAGSITVNCNRKPRKKKEGDYVSPPHYTFNYKDENGKACWKRIRPEAVERFRGLVENGRKWTRLAKEYMALATRLALAGEGSKKTSGCRVRGGSRSRKPSAGSKKRSPGPMPGRSGASAES